MTFSAEAAMTRSYTGDRNAQIARPTRKPAKPLSASRQSIRGNACAPEQEEGDGRQDDEHLPDRGVEHVEQARLIRAEEVEGDDADGVEELHRDRAEDQSRRASLH